MALVDVTNNSEHLEMFCKLFRNRVFRNLTQRCFAKNKKRERFEIFGKTHRKAPVESSLDCRTATLLKNKLLPRCFTLNF